MLLKLIMSLNENPSEYSFRFMKNVLSCQILKSILHSNKDLSFLTNLGWPWIREKV